MLIGHIAVGLAAKPLAPKASLGSLMVASTAIDTLCGVFLLTGIESVDATTGASSIPWSHGLFMAAVWSLAALALAFLISRDPRTSIAIGLVVASHWLLDWISHPMGMGTKLPPDLPLLFKGSPKVGLGLYNSAVAAVITEFGLFAAGVVVYLVTTRARDRLGKWSFWLIPLFLFLIMIPAAMPQLVLVPTLAMVLLLPLGNWVDRHRTLKTVSAPLAGE
jgi:hypothetical protein